MTETVLPVHPTLVRALRANRWGLPKPAGKHRRANEAIKARRKRERQNRRRNR